MAIKIVRENTERNLLETVALCRKMSVPLRCIYFPFAETVPQKLETWQEPVINALADVILEDDSEAIFYACSDGDLFIVSRVASRKMFLRLLEGIPGDLIPPLTEDVARLFEMNVDGHIISKICSDKIHAIQVAEAEKRRVEEEKILAARANHDRAIETDIAVNAAQIASLSARRGERKNPSVLVVEDDLFSQKLVCNALRADYEVHAAASGREGLMATIKNAPDLIFMDINLPDMTGLDILDEIFQVDPQAHVVMLSGQGSRDNVVAALQKGAKGFIGKPFTLEKLQQALQKCPFVLEKRNRKETLHG